MGLSSDDVFNHFKIHLCINECPSVREGVLKFHDRRMPYFRQTKCVEMKSTVIIRV